MSEQLVQGRCPACGRHTLWLQDDGTVTCGSNGCPQPGAVSELLDDVWILDHIVELRRNDFTLRHPMIERLHGGLFHCGVAEWLARSDGPPFGLGRYRMVRGDPGWQFEPVAHGTDEESRRT